MMIKRWVTLAIAAVLFLSTGCDKKPTAADVGTSSQQVDAVLPVVATHLGVATMVPKDADLFFASYHASDLAMELKDEWAPDMTSENQQSFAKMVSYVGNEAFLFVGPGAGSQLQMLGTSYREISAAWGGFAVGMVLDKLANKDDKPDFSRFGDELSGDLSNKWLDLLAKDSRLQVPSVVLGWKPAAEMESECLIATGEALDDLLESVTGAKPVSFDARGVRMTGYEIPGREVFAEFIEEVRGKLEENSGSDELLKQLSPERMERLLAAMENLRLTIAIGVKDGRVLVYLGNGEEGFRLAKSPDESLAATDDLRWTGEFNGSRITGVAYLSEMMVGAVPLWLDGSDYWKSLAAAIRPPVKEERLFREVLTSLATTEHELVKRDATAWSAVICENEGWRYESRGGWPDPTLDYDTPLRMTGAVLAAKPAIRAQWMQRRERKDLAWSQIEHYGVLIDAVIDELGEATADPMMGVVPEDILARLILELQGVNRAYRDEFRAGIGDEVAVILDFEGEVPAFPGISEETIKNGTAPRFVIARPVTDRAMVDASGKSFAKSWRSLTTWATEASGSNLPLILPQSLESDGLVTWYPPMPFIGGDFVPGVTLNDELWMLGTSRSMAGDFSKYLENSVGDSETGLVVEVDFAPIRDWFSKVYQNNREEADLLAGEAPDKMRQLATEENLNRFNSTADKIQGLGYRKWMADGKPRTSLHLRLNRR